MVAAFVACQCVLFSVSGRLRRRLARRQEVGQASAEYALVLLGAAGVAVLFGAWAQRTGQIGRLLDHVMDAVLSRVK